MNEGINLLPQQLKEVKQKRERFRRVISYCVLELSLLGVLVVGLFFYRQSLHRSWMSLQNNITEQKNIIASDQNRLKEGRFTLIKNKLSALSDIFSVQTDYSLLIESIWSFIPQGVRVVSFNQLNETFEISGQADNLDQVDVFLENIGDLEGAKSVSLDNLEYSVSNGEIIFRLSFIFD